MIKKSKKLSFLSIQFIDALINELPLWLCRCLKLKTINGSSLYRTALNPNNLNGDSHRRSDINPNRINGDSHSKEDINPNLIYRKLRHKKTQG